MEPPADWLTTVPARYLRRDVRFSMLSDARRLEVPTFVKPAEGKVFEPRVYSSEDSLPSVDQVGDIPVLTSTPVSWAFEARCFVLERKSWRSARIGEMVH